MYEVELRSRVDDLQKMENRLKRLGAKFLSEVEETDTYYGMKWDVGSIKQLKRNGGRIGILLRIRKRAEDSRTRHIFTMKTLPSDDSSIREEVELDIGDPERMREVLGAMRALEILTLHKRRRKFSLKNIDFLLDDIRELGTWIEAAREGVPKGHLRETREELERFMRRELGIENVESLGYFRIAVQELL